MVVKIFVLKRLIGFPVAMFMKYTVSRILPVTVFAFTLSAIPSVLMEGSFLRLVLTCLVSVVTVAVSTYVFGFEHSEKQFTNNKILEFKQRIHL